MTTNGEGTGSGIGVSERSNLIVVGLDGSDNSLAALRWALREAVTTGSSVEVVHGWEAQSVTDLAFGSSREMSCGSACMVQNEVACALSEMSGQRPAVIETSLHGRPSTILLDRAAHASMLVIGAHSRARGVTCSAGRSGPR